jgi:hypothetical protein
MYTVSLLDYDSDTPKEELYIYDPVSSDEQMMLIKPTLTIGASEAGTFIATLPMSNYGYGKIIKRLTRVIVRKNEKIIFMGRVNSDEKDLYLNQTIKAEGALSYLNDTLTTKRVFTHQQSNLLNLLLLIFQNHNSKFPDEPWKQFNLTAANCHADFVGRDDTSVESNLLKYYSVNYDITMNIVNELLELANAVLKIEYNELSGKWDVYIYPKYELPLCSQPIEFGQNLIDLTQSYDKTDICSVVAPFGGELVQQSKEIGEIVAGMTADDDPNHIYNKIVVRNKGDYHYVLWDVSQTSYANSGYWGFEFDISLYNQNHPNNPLKKLFLSWRAYEYEYEVDNNYICDCSWIILERIVGEGYVEDHNLGVHKLSSDGSFVSAINEEIDLSDPRYLGATHILMTGWGGLIKPIIRRDATIVEENDRLNIENCDVINSSSEDYDGVSHAEGSIYLEDDALVSSIGRIEKKLEYGIEDTLKPVSPFVHPYSGPLGGTAVYDNYALGYEVGAIGADPDLTSNEGDYKVIPFNGGTKVIEYQLPEFGSVNYPRGVYLSARMYSFGVESIQETGKQWMINGLYAIFDVSHQMLNFKKAEEVKDGCAFTTIYNEFIDLTDPKNFGAAYIRVGGYVGMNFQVTLAPSDDTYSRNRLMDQGIFYLKSQQWEKVVIEATAVDLSLTSDEWEMFDICTNAQVFSDVHGMYSTLPITTLEIGLDSFEDNRIKLGYDSDEYLSAQLAQNLRLISIEQTLEEKKEGK